MNIHGPNDAAWKNLCILGKKRRPISNVANAVIALAALETQLVGFDQMELCVMLRGPLSEEPFDHESFPRPVTDTDIGKIQVRLQRAGLATIGWDTVNRPRRLNIRATLSAATN
jgi:hypothetical protein